MMTSRSLRGIFFPAIFLAGLSVFLAYPAKGGVGVVEQANSQNLTDFAQCAKAVGWQEVYLPRHSKTQHLKIFEDYSKTGLKGKAGVIAVFHWAVLSSVEVPPSEKKRWVSYNYMNDSKLTYRFLTPSGSKYTINFSSGAATKWTGSGSAIGVETKSGERKLVAVLQQTVAIYSAEQPFRLLHQGYNDTFAYCIFSRGEKQPPEKE